MIYKIKYEKDAIKFMKKNTAIGLKFHNAFIDLCNDIKKNYHKYDIKKLKNIDDTYRLRISKYRAIFKIINDVLCILVLDINSRGEIYKK